jgi:flagellar basal-body rod protein FlgG
MRVRLPDGRQALTRDGSLRVDEAGKLVTSSGAVVQPAVTFPASASGSNVSIGPDGTVLSAGRRIGRIELVSVRSPQKLQPVGDNAFLATPESGAVRAAPASTTLTQGALEMSNVDMADSMVAMIESQRAFQLASKAITTADEMMGIANQVKR